MIYVKHNLVCHCVTDRLNVEIWNSCEFYFTVSWNSKHLFGGWFTIEFCSEKVIFQSKHQTRLAMRMFSTPVKFVIFFHHLYTVATKCMTPSNFDFMHDYYFWGCISFKCLINRKDSPPCCAAWSLCMGRAKNIQENLRSHCELRHFPLQLSLSVSLLNTSQIPKR